MHLRLGSFDAVVASSAGAARLVLKTHDAAFADRARTAAGELVAYNYKGIVHTRTAPTGAWRASSAPPSSSPAPRRLLRAHPRGGDRALARDLFGRAGRAVAVRERLASATLRNILRMSVGDKWSGVYGSADGEAFRRTLDEAFEVSGAVSNVGEWVSLLGWLDVQGFRRRMKRLSKMYDRFLEQILHEHEASMAAAGDGGQPAAAACDLVDVLLQLSGEEEEGSAGAGADSEARLTRDGVKAFILDIIAGGTESSAVAMEWAMAELLRRPTPWPPPPTSSTAWSGRRGG